MAIGNLNRLVIEPIEDKLWFIEVPDIHFNHNSAIPCIDDKGYLLSALVTAIDYGQKEPDKRLVLFGHTDTSGENAYNFDLSELRAKAVKAILTQDKTTWIEIVNNKSQVLDYQTILKNLTFRHGWQCDPGELDNKNGVKTQAAVKAFQTRTNQIYNLALVVDGVMGPKSWEAILTVMGNLLKEQLGLTALPKLNYGYSGNGGVYGCGESFPLEAVNKNDYKSQKNRRVELVYGYFHKIRLFPIVNKNQTLKPAQCMAYDMEKVTWLIIEPNPIDPIAQYFSL